MNATDPKIACLELLIRLSGPLFENYFLYILIYNVWDSFTNNPVVVGKGRGRDRAWLTISWYLFYIDHGDMQFLCVMFQLPHVWHFHDVCEMWSALERNRKSRSFEICWKMFERRGAWPYLRFSWITLSGMKMNLALAGGGAENLGKGSQWWDICREPMGK